jgi:hypothetical protein
MKTRFWQIQIEEVDKYKTPVTASFGHYEWKPHLKKLYVDTNIRASLFFD